MSTQAPEQSELLPEDAPEVLREYLLVSATNSKVIMSSADYNEIRRTAGRIRNCGGQVTVFKALKA